MPKLDGISFFKKLRDFNKETFIIAITALTREEDIKKIMLAGANNYISKPLNRYIFTSVITNLIDSFLKRFTPFNKKAINLFTNSIFNFRYEYFINNLDDIQLFISFFEKNHPLLSRTPTFRAIIEVIEYLCNQNFSISLIKEEDINHIYLTINDTKKLPQNIIFKIMKKHNIPLNWFQFSQYILSIIFFKNTSIYEQKEDNIEKVIFFSEIKEIEDILNETMMKDSHIIDAKSFMNTRKELYKEEINNIFITLEKLKFALNNFCDINCEKWPEYFDEIWKNLKILRKLFKTFKTFYLLDTVLKIFIDYLDNAEESLKEIRNRLLLCKTLHLFFQDLLEFSKNLFEKENLKNIFSYNLLFSQSAMTLANSLIFRDEEIF